MRSDQHDRQSSDGPTLRLVACKAKNVVGGHSTPSALNPSDEEQKVVAALINDGIVPIRAHGHAPLNALQDVAVHALLAGMQTGMARGLKLFCNEKFDEFLAKGDALEMQGIHNEQERKGGLLPAPHKLEGLFDSVPTILTDAEIDALPTQRGPSDETDSVFTAFCDRGFPAWDKKKGAKHARDELKKIEKARRHMMKEMKDHAGRLQFPFLFEK